MNHLKLKYFLSRFILFVCFGFLHFAGVSQNLVQNGSFEEIETCHDDKWKAYNIGSPRNFMPEWRSPNGGTPDPYGPSCVNKKSIPPNLYPGNCQPYSGNAIVGFGITFGGDMITKTSGTREYIQAKLTTPLKANVEYCISFYIHFAVNSNLKANSVEAKVSKRKSFGARDFEPIYVTPTIRDTTISNIDGWHLVQGTFLAEGGEEFLTIGNFSEMGTLVIYPNPPKSKKEKKEQTNGAYYYFDDVSLVEHRPGCSCDIPSSQNVVTLPESNENDFLENSSQFTKQSSRNPLFESHLVHDSTQYYPIDTLELMSFWTEFINAVETKNKPVVKESLSFDLFLAPLIAYPAFVADCDTVLFSQQNDFYGISKLTENNFDQYFDTIFSDNLVEILSQIKIENIIRDGQNTGYSYVYSYVLNREDFPCSDEIVVVINLFYQEGYKVSIEFCC